MPWIWSPHTRAWFHVFETSHGIMMHSYVWFLPRICMAGDWPTGPLGARMSCPRVQTYELSWETMDAEIALFRASFKGHPSPLFPQLVPWCRLASSFCSWSMFNLNQFDICRILSVCDGVRVFLQPRDPRCQGATLGKSLECNIAIGIWRITWLHYSSLIHYSLSMCIFCIVASSFGSSMVHNWGATRLLTCCSSASVVLACWKRSSLAAGGWSDALGDSILKICAQAIYTWLLECQITTAYQAIELLKPQWYLHLLACGWYVG